MSEPNHITPECYAELRRMAGAMMVGERRDHTLVPTALAHEVWLRLRNSRNAATLPAGAFLGVAAQAMRRILTEHARRRSAAKRQGNAERTTVARIAARAEPQDFAIDLDAALVRLEAIDPQLARCVELRFYAGCSVEDTAAAMSVSIRTSKRQWRIARAWLQQQMMTEVS